MSQNYTPNPTWEDGSGGGTPITSATLNHIEGGIEAVDTAAQAAATEKGVPAGGSVGQVLTKAGGADYDADWEDVSGTGTVQSVNNIGPDISGNITLTAAEVGADPVGAANAAQAGAQATSLQKASNLSDLANAGTARTNLGLGSAALQASSAFDAAGAAATVQAASLQKTANLGDVANAATARTNLGILSAATQPATAFLQKANNLSDVADTGSSRANIKIPMLVSCVAVAVTAVLSLTGIVVIDGQTPAVGDEVLLTAQASGVQNGKWLVAAGAWTRPTDYPTGAVIKGRTVQVVQGASIYAGSLWEMTTPGNVTIDTTATTWVPANSNFFAQAANVAPLAQTGQTPTQLPPAPVPGVTGTAGSLAVARRADAADPSVGLYLQFGDGSDGAVVLDGTNTYSFLSKSGSVYTMGSGSIYPSTLTVNAGVTLNTNGNLIFVSGTATINGTVTTPVGSASGSTAASLNIIGGQAFAALGLPPGSPTNGGTGVGTAPTSASNIGAGKGGSGGTGSSGAAANPNTNFGAGGDLTRALWRRPSVAFSGMGILQQNPNRNQGNQLAGGLIPGGLPGSSGSGDGTNSGGGAGDGGATLIFCARILVGSGTFTAPGGNGGNSTAGNTGGGGPGGGGNCIVNTTDATAWTGTVSALAGTPGTGFGTGTTASAGTAGYAILRQWA